MCLCARRLTLEWRERAFMEKVNSRCFCWFPAAILVDSFCPPIWRFHTKLYKGAWSVSANNSETVGHKDLRFAQILYILVFYNISFFWASSTGQFQMYLFWALFIAWQWKRRILTGDHQAFFFMFCLRGEFFPFTRNKKMPDHRFRLFGLFEFVKCRWTFSSWNVKRSNSSWYLLHHGNGHQNVTIQCIIWVANRCHKCLLELVIWDKIFWKLCGLTWTKVSPPKICFKTRKCLIVSPIFLLFGLQMEQEYTNWINCLLQSKGIIILTLLYSSRLHNNGHGNY